MSLMYVGFLKQFLTFYFFQNVDSPDHNLNTSEAFFSRSPCLFENECVICMVVASDDDAVALPGHVIRIEFCKGVLAVLPREP